LLTGISVCCVCDFLQVQKLRLFRDFRPRLVVPAAKDEWVPFPASDVTNLFNEHEQESMPSLGASDHRWVLQLLSYAACRVVVMTLNGTEYVIGARSQQFGKPENP
jgi:hypothetical protein